CKASREEDRLQILAKIPDVHEFDVQLQAVIFWVTWAAPERFGSVPMSLAHKTPLARQGTSALTLPKGGAAPEYAAGSAAHAQGAANSAAHARAAQAMAALACFCLLPGCSACAASKDAAPSSRCSCLMADCADCAVPARGQKRKRSDFAQSGKLLAAAAVLACMCLLPTCQPCAEGNGVLPVPRALRLRLPGAFPDEPLLSLEQPDCSIMWLLAASSPGFDRVDAAARAARRAASAAAASEGP
ncbi:unnamed protein product, partial [Polarella glacialis]